MDPLCSGTAAALGCVWLQEGKRNKRRLSSPLGLLFSAVSWARGQSGVCKDRLPRENFSSIEMLEGEAACPCAQGHRGVGWEDALDLGVEVLVRVSTSPAPAPAAAELRPRQCRGGSLGGTAGGGCSKYNMGKDEKTSGWQGEGRGGDSPDDEGKQDLL